MGYQSHQSRQAPTVIIPYIWQYDSNQELGLQDLELPFSPLSGSRVQVAAIDNHLFGKAEWLEPLEDNDTTTKSVGNLEYRLRSKLNQRMRVVHVRIRITSLFNSFLVSTLSVVECIALVDMGREVPYRGVLLRTGLGFEDYPPRCIAKKRLEGLILSREGRN